MVTNLKPSSVQQSFGKEHGSDYGVFKVVHRPCENHEGIAKGMLATTACGRCGIEMKLRMECSEEKPGLSGWCVETTLCRE